MQLGLAATIAAGGPAAVVDRLVPVLLGTTSHSAVAALRAVTLAQSAEGHSTAMRALSKDMGGDGTPIGRNAIRDRMKVLAVARDEDVLVGGADIAGFLDRAVVKKIARAGQ